MYREEPEKFPFTVTFRTRNKVSVQFPYTHHTHLVVAIDEEHAVREVEKTALIQGFVPVERPVAEKVERLSDLHKKRPANLRISPRPIVKRSVARRIGRYIKFTYLRLIDFLKYTITQGD